jgi:hypothetical protein
MLEPDKRDEAVPEHCDGDNEVTLPITTEQPERRKPRAPTISTPESDDDEATDVQWPPED